MSFDLLLKPSCSGCGSTTELYGSNCKHMTFCSSCGKTMAENGATCYECGTTITSLIREYNVRANSSNEKTYSIARFVSGFPNFSKKKNAENRWSAHKEGLQGRQVTDALREKFKNKPWLLEDETGQFQYHGHLEGSQSATYFLLISQEKDFVAVPAGSWYNFNKVAQYKQLTLEEAEEKMKNRKKTADGYERWMMKAATTGAAAFGEVVKLDDKESGGSGRGRKKAGDDDEGNASDKGDEDEEDESSRKSKLGLNKRGGDDDDEAPGGREPEMDDDDEEKGDDWEHEEQFTDDDERLEGDEEREDLANEAVPPEIKDDEDEEEGNEEGGGLSQSGKELKKLLGKASGLNESEGEDDDEDYEMDDEVAGNGISPVVAPKQKDVPKEEPVEDTPTKAAAVTAGSSKGVSPASKTSKGKRKLNNDDTKPSGNTPSSKKVKNEPEAKSSAKDGQQHPSKGGSSSSKSTPSPAASTATGPVTEEEIKTLLMQKTPITTQVLVGKFKDRLRSKEDKTAFADILRRISKIQKSNGSSFVVLR